MRPLVLPRKKQLRDLPAEVCVISDLSGKCLGQFEWIAPVSLSKMN